MGCIVGILQSQSVAGGNAHGFENVDFEVTEHSLKAGGAPFKPHAGIDILFGQGFQIVWWISHAIELREDQIPDLDRLCGAGCEVIDFGAGAANAIRSLRR